MHPAYFGLVMATGIVSTPTHLLGLMWIGQMLFWLSVVCYAILWLLILARLVFFYPRAMLTDLADHNRSIDCSLIAATSVLGSRFLFRNDVQIGTALWFLAIALWAPLHYTIFTTLRPSNGSNPRWASASMAAGCFSVVAAQSLSIPHGQHPFRPYIQDLVLYFALVMWLGGGVLYILIISLIFYRYLIFSLWNIIDPPYWINMGSVAISPSPHGSDR